MGARPLLAPLSLAVLDADGDGTADRPHLIPQPLERRLGVQHRELQP